MKREKIKTVAIKMVKKSGLINLSRRELCETAGIPDGSFPHIMGCNFFEFVNELKDENIESGMVAVSKRRVPAVLRKEYILKAAVDMAIEQGYHRITRDCVAEKAGVSFSLVTKYFGTMKQLRKDVMRTAIKQSIAEIVAQGLVNGDDRARKAPIELKAQAATLIANF